LEKQLSGAMMIAAPATRRLLKVDEVDNSNIVIAPCNDLEAAQKWQICTPTTCWPAGHHSSGPPQEQQQHTNQTQSYLNQFYYRKCQLDMEFVLMI
jgi:5-deoxy-D-glucuronate isomerase